MISQLEYCKLVLAVLPICTLGPFHLILNMAARGNYQAKFTRHTSLILKELCWLPIEEKVRTITFKALLGFEPSILTEFFF